MRAWLNAEGLSHYAAAFRRHGYTGEACAEVLAELDENNLHDQNHVILSACVCSRVATRGADGRARSPAVGDSS